ncbi:MAG: GNAT family N-acetyltransferase [Trichodesmium sp. MO_231.B1]|nr:GNAT family N-acetyltransferase [Trichodesmium sp. MO_231.B1]
MTAQIKIIEIDEKSPHLQTVIELGDANRKTLGHLSYDTFFDHAKRRQIIVALAPKENFIGYLMYRKVRRGNHLVIVHLCVTELWRGKGITRKLVNYLSQNYLEFYGIKLKCRRDYGLDKMWSKLGFVPLNEKPGKSKEGKLLTVWWLDHGHPNLFSVNATEKLDSKLCAIIDTTVFFDLHENDSFKNGESESLFADWLQDDLELCVTDEIFNAINNITDSQDRKYKRLNAEKLTKLPYNQQNFESFLDSIKEFMVGSNLKLDKSQIRQLAMTLASECRIFVTCDSQILNLTDEIYKIFQLEITNPSNLIINLDEIRRSTRYQPVRLAGSNKINLQSVVINQINQLTDYFWSQKNGETKGYFQRKLRSFITNYSQFVCHQLVMEKDKPVGLIVYKKSKYYELEIPLLRVKKDDSLSGTLARYLIFHSIIISAQENRYFTRITDSYLQEIVVKAIQEDAFIKNKGEYIKVNIPVAETASQLSQRLHDLAELELEYKSDFCLKIAKTISQHELTKNSQTTLEIERFLWPAKIIDANVPTWIIPIKPFWAKDLFDEELANNWLFGSKTELALKRELVFYRSKRGLKPGVIGRIIWYVSNDKDFPYGYGKTKVIKACSRLDEVIVDKPEKLYRQFRNLGVYKLEDLIKITKNNPNEDIMAIRFSDTQIFTNAITLKELQDILKKQITVQGLFKITPEQFAKIYDKANKN